MAASMSSARERDERFSERRGGDGGGHVVGKRRKRAIPRAALWGWRRACPPQEKETSGSGSGAVGMAAGMSSASDRNERFGERRGGAAGKMALTVITSDAAIIGDPDDSQLRQP
jgi:hypothetical protein